MATMSLLIRFGPFRGVVGPTSATPEMDGPPKADEVDGEGLTVKKTESEGLSQRHPTETPRWTVRC